MNDTAKPQRNAPGGISASGQTRPEMPRRKPGAPAAAANYPARKPGAPGAPSPTKRDEPSRTLRDDEDTLTGIESDEEE